MEEPEPCLNGDCTGQIIAQMQADHPYADWCIDCAVARTCVQALITTYAINADLGSRDYEVLGLLYKDDMLFYITTTKVDNEWLVVSELLVSDLMVFSSLGAQLLEESI